MISGTETIFHCKHPIRVRNKYDGKVYYVPCRKCSACRVRKAAQWTNRLNQESKCHPYSFFGTLTYAPEFLPYFDIDWENEFLTSKFDPDQVFSFNDLPLDKISYEFLKTRKCLPYARTADVTKFIKRVRERIRNNDSGEPRENRYLRYFVVSEYGETLLRPHFHFIFFTASDWFAYNAENVVSSCWSTDNRCSDSKSMGRIDVSSVKASASSYVSSYLNCVDNLPKIYSYRKFRPFSVGSRQPPIGTLFESCEEVQEIFSSGACTRTIQDRETRQFLEIPFPKSFCDRIYPRLSSFDKIPLDVLGRLYGESTESVIRSFEEFKSYVEGRARENSEVGHYYRDILLSCQQKQDSLNPDTEIKDPLSALHYLHSTLNRFHFNRLMFGVSNNDYVRRIYEFYKNRDYFMLKTQNLFLERITSDKSPCYYLLIDFDVLLDLRIRFTEYMALNDLQGFINYMKHYGIVFLKDSFSCNDFQEMSFSHDRVSRLRFEYADYVVSESKKRHEKNDYLRKVDIEDDLRKFLIYFNSIKHGCKKFD